MNDSSPRCLISAGPTREFFDPVRFISNPSSGKMGYSIAAAAVKEGWNVTLVSGPVSLPTPEGVARVDVVSAQEMYEAVDSRFDDCDILIMTAAVSDYRPRSRSDHKVKKDRLELLVEMEPTVDILKSVAARKRAGQYVVGFAAETDDVEAYARRKMQSKNCDMIVANTVGQAGSGFMSEDNRVIVLTAKGGRVEIGPAPKTEIAAGLIRLVRDGIRA